MPFVALKFIDINWNHPLNIDLVFECIMGTKKDLIDINKLVVGDPPCTYMEICDVISTSKSVGRLWSKLVEISRRLGLPEDMIILIVPRLLIGTKTHSTSFYEILEAWRGTEGRNAKLKKLLDVLEEEELKDCSDVLRKHFGDLNGITNTTTWSDLSVTQKAEICNKLVVFQGKQMQLGYFIDLNEMDGIFLAKVATGDIPTLVKTQTSQSLEYYIPRTIKSRNRIKPGVFQSQTDDIFVVQGIERQQLSILAKKNRTDVSGNQIRRLNVRFILLQYEPDFEKICKLSKQPTHWIKVTNGCFFWVKSSGPTKTIQQFIHTIQDCFTEKEIATNGNKFVSLSDSPGMGKTVLLFKLMEEIRKFEPTTFIHFTVLKEVVEAINKKNITVDVIASIIAERSSEFDYGRKLTKKAIITGKCILMLDGFDEVLPHQIDKAKKILIVLSNIDSIRIFVTTRPHMQEELENTLHVLSYTIEPFSESDRLNFLLKFWQTKRVNANESVVQFAKSCLETLSLNMTEFENEITGIPLQCRMLAETYVEEAERCSNLGHQIYEGQHCISLVTSIFQIYKTHIEMRFQSIETDMKKSTNAPLKSRFLRLGLKKNNPVDKIKRVHMYHALELIFPEEVSNFKHLLGSNLPVSLEDLCRCGIIEMTDLKLIRFVHRTFAEYLIAMFVADEVASKGLDEFKLQQIFSTVARKNDLLWLTFSVEQNARFSPFNWGTGALFSLSDKSFQFRFPVVCYFINELKKTQNQLDSQLTVLSSMFLSAFNREIELVVFASAFHNYAYVLVEVYKLFYNKQSDCIFKNADICDVLLTTARYCDVELMEAFIRDINLNKLEFPKGKTNDGTEFVITPLHIALQRGHYNLVEYLVNKFEVVLSHQRYLFHFCVDEGINGKKATLSSKKQIIKFLMTKSKQWLDEAICKTTPILQYGIIPELLECLIEEGADVNVFGEAHETVLHNMYTKTITPEDYHQIIDKLFKKGFKHFNMGGNGSQKTPLHYAVQHLELFDDTMQLLNSNGVDFNAIDASNESVLFYAIRSNRSVDLIGRLIKHGANLLHTDDQKNGVLHICSGVGHFKALQYFIEVHHMNVNVLNTYMDTPLHKAVGQSSENYERAQHLLINSGADVNARNQESRTPILEALLEFGLSLATVHLMEQHGLKVNQTVLSIWLKAGIWNRSITWSEDFASVLVYLIEKGGRFGNEIEWNPWNFESVKNSMTEILIATNVTPELLQQAENQGLLTGNESREVKETKDDDQSGRFYSFVKEKEASFEMTFKIICSVNQTNAFSKLRRALNKHFKQNQDESSSCSSDSSQDSDTSSSESETRSSDSDASTSV